MHLANMNVPQGPIVKSMGLEIVHAAGGIGIVPRSASEASVEKANIENAWDGRFVFRKKAFRCLRLGEADAVHRDASSPRARRYRHVR